MAFRCSDSFLLSFFLSGLEGVSEAPVKENPDEVEVEGSSAFDVTLFAGVTFA